MASSVFAQGNTALITGGASGIGLAVARLCAKNGMRLALVDISSKNLALAQKEFGDVASTFEFDVTKTESWDQLRKDVAAKFESIDLLMLNAAKAVKGGWENNKYFRETLDTNLYGVVNGINTFLPVIQSQTQQKPSAIVITGSKQGITNPPGNPAYNASKAAIKALAEHLSYDLRGSLTSVHLLVPGWTFTGLSGGGPGSHKDRPAGAWTPEQVAQRLEKQVRKGHNGFWCICPDNDVTEEMDKQRILWSAGDAVYDRPPLSRWREEHKDEAQRWMNAQKF